MSVTLTLLTLAEACSLLLRAHVITLDDIEVSLVDGKDELGFLWEEHNGEDYEIWVPKDDSNKEVEQRGNMLTLHDVEGEPVSVKLFTLTPLTE
jgi:hypothetical protein